MPGDHKKRVTEDYKKRLEIGTHQARAFLVGVAYGSGERAVSEDFIKEYADYYARHNGRSLPDCWNRFNQFGTIDPIPNYPPGPEPT